MKFNANVGKVKEVDGSVLFPIHSGLKIIVSAVSLSGEYSSPLYNTLVKRYGKVREDYRGLYINRNIKLGNVHSTATSSETWVMQMVCLDAKDKVDKTAVDACVAKLVEFAQYEQGSLHVSELLFTELPTFKKALLEQAPGKGVNVYIYLEPVAAAKASPVVSAPAPVVKKPAPKKKLTAK